MQKKLITKKCNPFSFPILGGRDSTRALQSIPFQNPGGVPIPPIWFGLAFLRTRLPCTLSGRYPILDTRISFVLLRPPPPSSVTLRVPPPEI